MEIKQLYYFKTIAETGNISKAANIVFVSQPALTKSLQNLEKELEVPLFDRDGKRIILNEAGQILYSYACKILTQVSQLEYDIATYRKIPQAVKIFVSETLLSDFIIPEFQFIHPAVKLAATLCDEKDLNKSLLLKEKGSLIISREPILDQDVCHKAILEDDIMLHVPSDSPLAQLSRVPLEALRGESLAIGDKSSCITKLLMQCLDEKHLDISYTDLRNTLFYSTRADRLNIMGFTTSVLAY